MAPPNKTLDQNEQAIAQRHLKFGWWSLLVFLTLGTVLELLHGFKVGWYLDANNVTRRLMWTLSHAHGTLLALVHIAFAVTTSLMATCSTRRHQLASAFLIAASVLLPSGFFLGGCVIYSGDPGIGIFLVPVGALALFVAVFLTALCCQQSSSSGSKGKANLQPAESSAQKPRKKKNKGR